VSIPPLPRRIGTIAVPRDAVSAATWAWANRRLPRYLLAHSVRAYAWAAALGAQERVAYEPAVLWPAALMHDVGLTQIPRNTRCFEFQGAAIARRFLIAQGMTSADADRVGRAIELHMASAVTLADGAESVLLDRATAIDVRGTELDRTEGIRAGVVREFPRGPFDALFFAAMRRETDTRPGCQSERLVKDVDLAAWMAPSRWPVAPEPRRGRQDAT
jgi:hypothetical protein